MPKEGDLQSSEANRTIEHEVREGSRVSRAFWSKRLAFELDRARSRRADLESIRNRVSVCRDDLGLIISP